MTIILGIDPGLGTTGWGVIRYQGNRLSHIANGQIRTNAKAPLPSRLLELDTAIAAIVTDYRPDGAAIEEIYVNKNPQTTLKLVQARGGLLLSLARGGLGVGEYAPRLIKKAIVGTGAAEKVQIDAMVQRLLPGVQIAGPDAADALAVAITHAHLAGHPR
ncbi:MAG: crossover junction endodeoxyribonuclease RuvC [Sphingomonadales bacterium RIFCSPHIGHO2_01_FULL_65_20]|uniref:crossover junction endodeoxyribonuclease RuvC n=1 Tax=unclassified Blastomonas TaxID=2626550 RepID=UPI000834BF87|nr:crossover junction endodeoxyribonuclease RuvC [Blastomonas sp.]MCH2237147.1 crossover junction endodeoxyribonuclease RuvC [Blastomonas sp.]OHC92575.1 MAG: crossover junction endodeoxyribonuclease RuvC [Sphingomonadales bacterium RIFCSPHIGHO2_01_FULL_65_20]